MEEKEQINSSTQQTSQDQMISHRRKMILPLVVGVIIIICGGLLVGALAVHRHPIGADKYARSFNDENFGNRHLGSGRMMMGAGHRFGQRLLGSITAITGNVLTLHNSSADQSIVISDSTSIYKNGQIAKQSDLKVGDVISVSGKPNSSGQIQAILIEIQ